MREITTEEYQQINEIIDFLSRDTINNHHYSKDFIVEAVSDHLSKLFTYGFVSISNDQPTFKIIIFNFTKKILDILGYKVDRTHKNKDDLLILTYTLDIPENNKNEISKELSKTRLKHAIILLWGEDYKCELLTDTKINHEALEIAYYIFHDFLDY